MEMIACTCEEGYGLPHSHVGLRQEVINKNTGITFWLPSDHIEMNPRSFSLLDGHLRLTGARDPAHIRIWVNWKDVARAVMNGG
jgi:hypothetical protein